MAKLTGQTIVDLIRVRANAKEGKEAAEVEAKRLEEMIIHLWGSLLFELRANCERARHMIAEAKVGAVVFGPFDFTVSDALIATFAEIVPQPVLLAHMNSAIGALRRIDFFQRQGPSGWTLAVGFARDAENKKLFERYNDLRKLADRFGELWIGEGWSARRPNILPGAIDSAALIDHNLI